MDPKLENVRRMFLYCIVHTNKSTQTLRTGSEANGTKMIEDKTNVRARANDKYEAITEWLLRSCPFHSSQELRLLI